MCSVGKDKSGSLQRNRTYFEIISLMFSRVIVTMLLFVTITCATALPTYFRLEYNFFKTKKNVKNMCQILLAPYTDLYIVVIRNNNNDVYDY